MKYSLIFIVLFFQTTYLSGQVNSISEQLIHSTVRIECQYRGFDKKGKVISYNGTGSAFIFEYSINDSLNTSIPVIVTNKHVVKNATKGTFYFTKKDSIGNPTYGEKEKIEIIGFQKHWIPHPDSSIDLCIMPIAPILRQSIKDKKPIYYTSLSENLIPSEDIWNSFTALEEIIMIGYPNGLWDSKNNLPITRVGQTATPLKIDYMGKQEFLIDIPAFPGSSGSPVILFNQGSYSTDEGISVGSRLYLLGVLYAGPLYNAKGKGQIIINNLPTNINTKTGIPINIGLSIKSSTLLDFKKLFTNEN